MNTLLIVVIFNLLFAGILSGMEVGFHYGLHGPTERLNEHSQLQLRQALVMRLRVLVPAFFVPTAVTAVIVIVLEGTSRGLSFRCAGMLGVITWIAIRVVGTVPINSATVDWDLNAPPSDWRERVAHAERFHILGVWAAVGAFACFLVNLAMMKS